MAKGITDLVYHGDTEDTERELVGLSGSTDKPLTVSLFEAKTAMILIYSPSGILVPFVSLW